MKLKNFEVGLFFYAGHGIQAKGYNYLIPVDAELKTEAQVEYDCVQADRVLALMEESGAKVKIVILDACRNNPFERSWTRAASGKGLATMNAPSGTLIAYSTAPGSTASDGSGNNSLYTSAILENIVRPNIPILQMFQNVRAIVSQKSSKEQIPWESTSLTGDFYFNSDSNLITTDNNQSNIVPIEYYNKANNKEYTKNINPISSSRDIRIIQLTQTDSLNNNDTTFYVTLNKGLNSRIKPNNYLRLYSPTFVKSTISGENMMSEIKRIGHIIVLNSYAEKSEGKLEFDKGIDLKNEFNQNLSYARKKTFWNTLYLFPKIKIWTKDDPESGNYNSTHAKSTIGLGYAIYGYWGGLYTEISPFKYSKIWSWGGGSGVDNVSDLLFSGGLIKKAGKNTGLKFGVSTTFNGESGVFTDFGMINTFANDISIISSFSLSSYNILISFGIGYTF